MQYTSCHVAFETHWSSHAVIQANYAPNVLAHSSNNSLIVSAMVTP